MGFSVTSSNGRARVTLSASGESVSFSVGFDASQNDIMTRGVMALRNYLSGGGDVLAYGELRTSLLRNISAIHSRVQRAGETADDAEETREPARPRPQPQRRRREQEQEREPPPRRETPARRPRARAPPRRRQAEPAVRYNHQWVRARLNSAGEGDASGLSQIEEHADELDSMLGNRAQRSLVLAGILHDLYEATGSNGGRFYFFTRAFTPARRIDNALMQVADGNISQAARLLRRGNRQENEDAAIQLIRSYLVFAAERTGTSTDANAARTFGQELNALLPDGIPEELNPNFIIAAGLYTRRMNNPDAPRYAIPEEVERRVAEPVHMPEREFGDQIESHITREEGLFRPEYMRPIRRAAPRPRPEPRERQEEMTPRQYARSIRELLRQIPEDSEIAAEARRTIRHLRSTNTRIIGNAMRQAPELITRLETEARENPRPPLEERRRPQGGEAQGAAGRRRSDRQADSQEPVSGRRNILVIGDSLTASIGRNPQSIRTFESAMEEQEGVSMGEEPVMHGFTGASAYEISNHLFSRRRRSSGREAQEDDDRQRRIRARREAILDARDDIRLNRSDYTDVFIEMGGNDLNARGTSPLISAVQIINSLEQAYETASRQWGLRVFGVTIPPGWGYNGSRDPSQSNNPSGAWGISNERVRDLVNEWIRGNVYLLYRSNRRGRPQEIVDVVGREEFDRSDYGDDIEVLSPPSLSGVVDLDPVLMQNPYETPYHEVEEWNQGTLRERYNLGRRADPDLVRDGLHPNEEGQEQIMRAFAGVLHPPIEETMPRREDLDLTDEHRQRNLERAEDPAISLKSGKRRRAIAR